MEGEKAEAQTKNEAATPQQIVNRSKVEHLLSPLKSPASHRPNLEMVKRDLSAVKTRSFSLSNSCLVLIQEEEEEMLKRSKSMEGERAETQTKNESATPQQIENPSNIELLFSSVKSSVKSSANRCLSFQTVLHDLSLDSDSVCEDEKFFSLSHSHSLFFRL